MKQLPFISNECLKKEIIFLLEKAAEAKTNSSQSFGSNVVDPVAAMFEMTGFGMNHEQWKLSETARQAQKSLQNHIGTFHQNILGSAQGWNNMKTGNVVDLKCVDKKIIAEVKNKYSTISGGKLGGLYNDLEKLVMPKSSEYKDFTAYYVVIIPKKAARFDREFVPSDNTKGAKCTSNSLIREIDGVSFYDLVFQEEQALKKIYDHLPSIITDVDQKHVSHSLSKQDIKILQQYFSTAFPA